MTATTRSMIHQPRHKDAVWPAFVAGAGALFFVLGWAAHPTMGVLLNLGPTLLMSALAVFCIWRIWRRHGAHISAHTEAEAATTTIIATFMIIRCLSGVTLDLYPLLYMTLACIIAFTSKRTGVFAVSIAITLECISQWTGAAYGHSNPDIGLTASLERMRWLELSGRMGFFVAFGALSHIIHGAELMERRARHREEVEQERENMLREAREFRLINSGRVWETSAKHAKSEDLILFDAVEAVHHTTYISLCLLKNALSCHTCILLWFDTRSERLLIKELVSESDHLTEGSIDPARGAIGGITRRREVVHLKDLKPGYRGLPYYREASGATHFLGVPILEQGHLRGVLCVDRTDDKAFKASDVDMLEETAAYILRAIQNERLFASIEKSKYELSRFFEASRRLNAVLTPQDVYAEALRSIAEITPFDFAAVTTYDMEEDVHTLVLLEHAQNYNLPHAKEWTGTRWSSNSGLTSMVVKNQHYLPYAGQVRETQSMVFTHEHMLPKLQSLLVLPLLMQDRAIGTIVMGHRKANRYGNERREMLEIVSNQVAITLQNANLYAQMEHMATRDALTGLSNRRAFFTRLDETIARHKRNKRSFALILTDIDHFKSVNDTYGHPVGDEVLRCVATIFRNVLRESDLPARYGGEEFVVLLEETGLEGARVLADRLREAVKAKTYSSEQGSFQCTISMGLAAWPDDVDSANELIEYADQALYHSKKSGRDRVTAYRDLGA